MNSQRAPLPVRKRPLPGERPARIKSFFSFKTPDSKASAKSPNEFCVLRALIQRGEERTERRYLLPRERISGSGVRRRRVRENVSAEQERLNPRSEEHTSELQSPDHLVCRLLLEKKNRHNQG